MIKMTIKASVSRPLILQHLRGPFPILNPDRFVALAQPLPNITLISTDLRPSTRKESAPGEALVSGKYSLSGPWSHLLRKILQGGILRKLIERENKRGLATSSTDVGFVLVSVASVVAAYCANLPLQTAWPSASIMFIWTWVLTFYRYFCLCVLSSVMNNMEVQYLIGACTRIIEIDMLYREIVKKLLYLAVYKWNLKNIW